MTTSTENFLLLGVAHTKANVKPVREILKKVSLTNKAVFTEGENRPGKSNQEFFKPIIKFLLTHGAVILHEIDEISLTELAIAKYKPIYNEKYAEKIRIAQKFFAPIEDIAELKKAAHDELMTMLGQHRDPNILKLILDNNPDLAIMGDGHAERIYPDLQEKLGRPVDYRKFV